MMLSILYIYTYYCSMFASMFSLVKCNVHIKVEYIFISHVLVGGD